MAETSPFIGNSSLRNVDGEDKCIWAAVKCHKNCRSDVVILTYFINWRLRWKDYARAEYIPWM